MRFIRQSLAIKIAVLVAGLLLSALTVYIVMEHHEAKREAWGDARRSGQAIGTLLQFAVADHLPSGLTQEEQSDLRRLFTKVSSDAGAQGIVVFDQAGQVVLQDSGEGSHLKAGPNVRAVLQQGDSQIVEHREYSELRFYLPLHDSGSAGDGGPIVGVVHFHVNLRAAMEAGLASARRDVIGAALTTLALIGLLLLTLDRIVLKPARRLSEQARRLARAEPIEVDAANLSKGDELARLSADFQKAASLIAERSRSLEESEARLRLSVEAADLGAFDWDLRSGRIVWSPRLEEIFGVEPGAFTGTFAEFERLVHPDDLAALNAALAEHMRQREAATHEFRVIRPDGVVRWMSGRGRINVDDAGEPVRMYGVVGDVTERHEMVQRLRDSLVRFELVTRAVGEGIWEIDLRTGQVFWSEGVYRLLGVTPGSIEPSTVAWLNRIHEDDRARVEASTRRDAPIGLGAWSQEYRIIWPDGQVRHVMDRGLVESDADGRPVRIVGSALDVTDRWLAEQAIARSEERYRQLFQFTPVPMWVFDSQTLRFLDVNEAAVRHYGYTREEFLTRTIMDIRPPDAVDQVLQAMSAPRSGFELAGVYQHLKKDGTLIDVEVYSHRLGDAGLAGGQTLVLSLDVTSRIKTAEALRQSEARLAGMFESAMDGIISVDERQDIILFNAAAEQIFKCPASKALGGPVDRFIPERLRPAHHRKLREFAASGERSRRLGLVEPVYGLRADGEEFPIEASVSQIDVAGQRLFTIMLRDVTERKRHEERQRFMMQELDHRVKNNLATVVSIAEQTIATSSTLDDFGPNFMGRIAALARMHATLAKSKWEGIELAALLRQILEPYVRRDDRVSLVGQPAQVPSIAASPLCMALHELATNAAKYGALSVPQGMVAVEWDSRPGMLSLRWHEHNGPAASAPARRGYGTQLIEGLIRYELGGQVNISYPASGLICDIMLPLNPRT